MEETRALLKSLAEEKYREFSKKLIPNVDNILGIRIPELRKIAKEISKKDWKEFLDNENKEYFEEIMLEGFVIGYAKTDIEESLEYIKKFVPKINNWSTCDSCVTGFKFTKKNMAKVWEFILPYLDSEKEYDVRFAVVMILSFYIEEAYIDQILRVLNQVEHKGYYVQMAVAWAISICFVKFPVKTEKFLLENNLDDFTHNKSIQKILDSFRVTNTDKIRIRKIMREKKC